MGDLDALEDAAQLAVRTLSFRTGATEAAVRVHAFRRRMASVKLLVALVDVWKMRRLSRLGWGLMFLGYLGIVCLNYCL